VEFEFQPALDGTLATSLKLLSPTGLDLGGGWYAECQKPLIKQGPWLPTECSAWQNEKRVLFSKEAVPEFIERLWPILRGWGRLPLQAVGQVERWMAGMEFRVESPAVEWEMEGSLETISVRGRYRYGDRAYAITEKAEALPASTEWHCTGAGRYWRRDSGKEAQVLRELAEAGFRAARSQPDVWVLEGNQRILVFLADRFRDWRRRWSVAVGARLGRELGRYIWVEPKVRCVSGGGMGDWLSVQIEYGTTASGGLGISEAEARELVRSGSASRRLRNGQMALVARGPARELEEILFECDGRQEAGELRIPARQAAFVLGACAAAGVAVEQDSQWAPPRVLEPPRAATLPDPWLERLRPYQVEGVRWLDHLARHGLGGILADEMGLGKTVQILGWLAWKWSELAKHPRASDSRGVLVVCPTSLVANWESEIGRFLGGMPEVVVWSGPKRKTLHGKLDAVPIVLTSYAVLRRDVGPLSEKRWETVVLDEAQHIKNRFSQIASAVKRLRAGERFVLTGTPIENSVADLWALFDFLMPGYLGGANEFRERYEQPLAKGADAAVLNRLRHRVGPFVLRRTKAEVGAELPERTEHILRCDLTPEQSQVYNALLRQAQRALDASMSEGASGGAARMQVFTALMRLRQACCHLDLLPRKTDGTDAERWKEPSCKVDAWLELMDEAVEGGHRVLVFSQFTSLFKIVKPLADERGWRWCELHGGMPSEQRADEVRKFQEDADIPLFFISLKAGGVGLNLTGADTVVQWDPWWNPAVEEQAMARAHRLGQTRVVMGYRIIARGTIEEKMLEMQASKRNVAEGLMASDAGRDSGSGLNWEELRELLS
jgi:superfamily II DNA or RNA helicase